MSAILGYFVVSIVQTLIVILMISKKERSL